MKIITETDDARDGLAYVRNISKRHIQYARNEDGNVGGPGTALRITKITVELTPEELDEVGLAR